MYRNVDSLSLNGTENGTMNNTTNTTSSKVEQELKCYDILNTCKKATLAFVIIKVIFCIFETILELVNICKKETDYVPGICFLVNRLVLAHTEFFVLLILILAADLCLEVAGKDVFPDIKPDIRNDFLGGIFGTIALVTSKVVIPGLCFCSSCSKGKGDCKCLQIYFAMTIISLITINCVLIAKYAAV